MRVILASGSPRRKELLAKVFAEFEVIVPVVDEGHEEINDPSIRAMSIARDKGAVVAARFPDALVVAADTIVALEQDGAIVHLGKPHDIEDAKRMLGLLSGRSHHVVTGVALFAGQRNASFAESSVVTFRPLTVEDIERYIATGEPMDKAGAYGIQGPAAEFASSVAGSLHNVIGLPIKSLTEHLARWNSFQAANRSI